MRAFLLNWNPKNDKEPWDIKKDKLELERANVLNGSWNTISKQIKVGDRIYIIRLGSEPKGIFASGYATSEPYRDKDWKNPNKDSFYIKIKFDTLLVPEDDGVLSIKILQEKFPVQKKWDLPSSGVSINDTIIDDLKLLWLEFTSKEIDKTGELIKAQTEISLVEGSLLRIMSSKYDRNPKARAICISNYGYQCYVCGFDFKETYGQLGEYFIHVHHKTPIAFNKGVKYTVDPLKDLVPICPNCHSMIHRKSEAISVEELKAMIIKKSIK